MTQKPGVKHNESVECDRRLQRAIQTLTDAVPNPHAGLPDPVFAYISHTTPLVNVDLLIKDKQGRTLLAWRDDRYAGRGWHVPGGIIRFQETMAERIRKVARQEIGVPVDFDPAPIAIHEMIHHGQAVRGHFISLLFKCRLDASFIPDNKGRTPEDAGYLQWHETCPGDMIAHHDVYRRSLLSG